MASSSSSAQSGLPVQRNEMFSELYDGDDDDADSFENTKPLNYDEGSGEVVAVLMGEHRYDDVEDRCFEGGRPHFTGLHETGIYYQRHLHDDKEIKLATYDNDVSSVLATEVLASLLHEVLGYDNIIIQRYQLYDFPSLNTNSSDVCSMGSQNDGASMKLVETNTVKCETPIGTCPASLDHLQRALLPKQADINVMGKFASYGFERTDTDPLLSCVQTDPENQTYSQCQLPNVGDRFGRDGRVEYMGLTGPSLEGDLYVSRDFTNEMWRTDKITPEYWKSMQNPALVEAVGGVSTQPAAVLNVTRETCPYPGLCDDMGFLPGVDCAASGANASGNRPECFPLYMGDLCSSDTLVPQIVRNLNLSASIAWLDNDFYRTITAKIRRGEPTYFFGFEPSILVNTLKLQEEITKVVLPPFNKAPFIRTAVEDAWNVTAGYVNTTLPMQLYGKFAKESLDDIASDIYGTMKHYNITRRDLSGMVTNYTTYLTPGVDRSVSEGYINKTLARRAACSFVKGREKKLYSMVSCLPGKQFQMALTQCVDCNTGSYSEKGMERCVHSPPGTYVASPGSDSYQPCPPGFFCETTGCYVCQSCPVDQYARDPGAKKCDLCPIGTTNDDSHTKCVAIQDNTSMKLEIILGCISGLLILLVVLILIMWKRIKRAREMRATKERIAQHQLVSLEAPINKAIDYIEKAMSWRNKFWFLNFFMKKLPNRKHMDALLSELKSGKDPRVPYVQYQIAAMGPDEAMGNAGMDLDALGDMPDDLPTFGEVPTFGALSGRELDALDAGHFLVEEERPKKYDGWDFDIFEWITCQWERVSEESPAGKEEAGPDLAGSRLAGDSCSIRDCVYEGRLTRLAMHLFEAQDLFTCFRIDPQIFKNFVDEVEGLSYDNPFHNVLHAADVLQSLHYLMMGKELRPLLNRMGILAGYIAAIVMDVGHLGVTNSFLQESGHQLANTYCLDNAIQECFHASIFCQLLASKQTNFLAKMDPTLFKQIKDLVLALITATDMNRHYQILNTFQTSQNILPEMLVIGLAEEDCESLPKAYPAVEEKAFLYLQIALKCADVAWTGRPFHAHLRWAEHYQEERFSQGDKERLLGFRVGSSNDRKRDSKARARALVAFYEFVVHPLFKSFECVFPSCSEMVKHAEKNYWYWELTSS